MRLVSLVVLLLLAVGFIHAHADHGGSTATTAPKTIHDDDEMNGMEMDDDDEEEGMGMHMGGPMSEEEIARKQKLFVLLHAAIASAVVFATLPVSIALIAGRKIEYHRQLSALNCVVLLFAGAVAWMGFSDRDSFHAKFAIFALVCFTAQSIYGVVKQYLFTGLDMQKHRFAGVLVFVLMHFTWWSGFYHIAGCNENANSLQICNAHAFLGMVFCSVGLVNLYYADHADFVSKMEMTIICIAAVCELVGEGLGDLILSAQDPEGFAWDGMAKVAHLRTAFVWIFAVLVAKLLAWKWPSTLPRGLALIFGSAVHMILLFLHDHEDNSLTPAAHRLHEFALLPLIIVRFLQLRRATCFVLLVSGLAFASAAEPVAETFQSTFNAFAYLAMIVIVAALTQALHVGINVVLLTRKNPTSTLFSRSGWERVVRFACCVCLCPSLVRIGDEEKGAPVPAPAVAKYEAAALQEDEDNSSSEDDEDGLQEDVTSMPDSKV